MFYATLVTQNTLGSLCQPSSNSQIIGYSDADWASNVDDCCSIAAYCIFVGNNIVSWSSKKQLVIARLNTESEYRALAHASTEIMCIQQLLFVLHLQSHLKSIFWCDNMSAGALTTNPVFHA